MLAACTSNPSVQQDTDLSQQTSSGNPESTNGDGITSLGTQGALVTELIEIGDRVFFLVDSSTIDAQAIPALEGQALFFQRNPGLSVTIEGHADERGTREYNLALGARRANAVKEFLVSLGVDGARISTISFGKERPEVLGSNQSAWNRNRRGVTVIN